VTYRPWTGPDVYHRFLEAAFTDRALPNIKRPKEYGNAMPQALYDDDDRKGWEANREERVRFVPPAGAITRRDEVLDWSIRYLSNNDKLRGVLWGQVICRARGLSFAKFCRKWGMSKSTAYRRFGQSLEYLAEKLNGDAVVFVPADVDALERMGQVSIPSQAG
jgi:hypothetical protein